MDHNLIQENFIPPYPNDYPRNAGVFINFVLPIYPLSFFHWYETDKYKVLENSNKMIAPQSILTDLFKYNNISSPYFFQFPLVLEVVGVYEFIEGIDGIYLPERIFSVLKINPGTQIAFQLINTPLVKGIRVTFKPMTSELLEINDPKSYLENHLRYNYSVLVKGSVISLPLPQLENIEREQLMISITNTNPDNKINITDCDLEIEFEEPDNYPEYLAIKESIENEKKKIEEELKELDRLKQIQEHTQNYKPGKLFFGKFPKNKKDDDKSNNNEFQSFMGNGNRLGD